MRRFLLPAALLFASAWACKPPAASGEAADGQSHVEHGPGPAVATLGADVITVGDFEKHMSEQAPFIRSRYTTLEKRKEFLDSMVRFELLAQEARREGLERDPEVAQTIEKVLVQRLVHKKFDDSKPADIPEADLRKYYEQHEDEYVKPERIRLQLVELKSEGNDSAVEAEAKKDLAMLRGKADKNDLAAFATLASSRSDDVATKLHNGDTDYRTGQELADRYGEGVEKAAEALKNVNELSGVIHGKGGLFLVRLLGRQAAVNRSFDQVRPSLVSRLSHEQHQKDFEDFVKSLREKAHVTIDDQALAKATVGAPDLSGSGPGLRIGQAAPLPPPMAATPPGQAVRLPSHLFHGPQLPPGAKPIH
ncbi:MAG: peptidylprolyl isomerase [Deltaproteobacteria bacterium]